MDLVLRRSTASTVAAIESLILFASSSVLAQLIKAGYVLQFSRPYCSLYCQFLRTAAIASRQCSSYSYLSLSSCLQGSHYFHCTARFTGSDAVRVSDVAYSSCLS